MIPVLLGFCLAMLAAVQAGAVACPGNGAKLTIVVNNPTTTTGQKVFLSGQTVPDAVSCIGQSDTYATTVTLTSLGDNTFTIPVGGGLNSGQWVHHISVGDQFQHQRVPVLYTTIASQYTKVSWTYFPSVIQVTTAGDGAGTCSASSCTFRQAIAAANNVSLPRPVLIQLMLAPGNMTQSSALAFSIGGKVTIDGTDVSGNPYIVGDALAAAQGNQSPFTRAVDLRNVTRFSIGVPDVSIRGLAISNTVASGNPSSTLIESTAAGTVIDSVRLDGGASGSCSPCPRQDSPNLIELDSGSVRNVEGRASFANGFFGDFAEITDSWFHHNYRSGVGGGFNLLERNTIELTGRKLNNAVVNSGGIGVGGAFSTSFAVATEANLIRNNQSFGVEMQIDASFADDAVCGNGDSGISFEGGATTSLAHGTGLATAYNSGHGVRLFGSLAPYPANTIQFNDDSAFTANAACGFANASSTGITASADNNQWRGATTSCTQSAGVDLCTGSGFGPVSCPTVQDPRNVGVTLDSYNPTAGTAPVFPMNASVQAQTLRVQGSGFNAIDGNPLAAGGVCAIGSSDVSGENCCRKKVKANVCDPGAPPNPPGNRSMCVAMVDPLLQWRPLEVTSVTPTTMITEIPNPFMLCVGDDPSLLQSIRVVKQNGVGGHLADQMDYCRN